MQLAREEINGRRTEEGEETVMNKNVSRGTCVCVCVCVCVCGGVVGGRVILNTLVNFMLCIKEEEEEEEESGKIKHKKKKKGE